MNRSHLATRESLVSAHSARLFPSIGHRLAQVLFEQPEVRRIEEVTEDVLKLGQFIAAHYDQQRTRLLQVSIAGSVEVATNRHSLFDLPEYRHSERHQIPSRTRPQPNAILSLYGKDYGHGTVGSDIFMCRFGVAHLKSGERLIQVVPYEWEGPSGVYEYPAAGQALQEVFGDDSLLYDLGRLARVDLGLMNSSDSTTHTIREFNPNAFGCDLLQILDRISSTQQVEPTNFQIFNGNIEQF